MSFKLRIVQNFDKRDSVSFLELERKFVEMEKTSQSITAGRRFIPVIGKEPSNTMVWEADFPSMEAVLEALKTMEDSDEHDKLLSEQVRYMRDNYIEIYEEFV